MNKASTNSEVIQRLLKTSDVLFLASACFVMSMQSLTAFDASMPPMIAFASLTLAFFVIFLMRGFGQYELKNLSIAHRTIVSSVFIGAFSGFVYFVIAPSLRLAIAPAWLMNWFSVIAIYMAITRLGAKSWIGQNANLKKRIAIVGGGKAAEDAIITLEKSKGLDIEIVGLFDDRFDNRSPESVRKHKKIGKISDLADYARANTVDLIIVAIPMSAEQRMLQILKRLWELPVDIRVSGQAAALKLSPRAYTYLGELPLLALFDRPLNGWSQFMKDTMDRAIALVALVLLSPVMLAVAAAVRYESKGPIIFKQKRFGFNNELIEVFKFRSMYTDMSDAAAVKLVTKDDPRVTKVGRIIRKTSLDELPQLFNVLTGQLSLVGPRPHATQAKAAGELYDQVIDGYFARHKVKPGITGWAQINGWRGETDTHEKIEQRVKHDLDYIDRWSLVFDLYIIAKTPLALLKSENAY
jgi:Undecaprenyl-phosphate glucose phosphotransferase